MLAAGYDHRHFPGLQTYFGGAPSTWQQSTGDAVDVTFVCYDTEFPSEEPTQQPTEEPTEEPTEVCNNFESPIKFLREALCTFETHLLETLRVLRSGNRRSGHVIVVWCFYSSTFGILKIL